MDVVAREAGVSKATVSKVLNQRPNIAPETRRLVEETIQRLGYVPTTGPRLAAPRTQVNLVLDSLINVYSMQVLDAIVAAASGEGLDVVVNVLQHQKPGPATPLGVAWIRDVAAREASGRSSSRRA